MKRLIAAAGVLGLIVVGATAVRAAQDIKEGKWSMTMTIQAEGMEAASAQAMEEMAQMSPEDRAMMEQMMGGMGMQVGAGGGGMTIKSSQCLTNDQPVPQQEGERDCEVTHTTNGNTVTFDTVCPDSTSHGQITYQRDAMQGTITTTKTERGKPVISTISISGQYAGPC